MDLGNETRSPHVVVVGGGIAGQALCETLKERDDGVRITLICAEPHLPYDRVNLSELLAEVPPEGPLGTLQLRPGPDHFRPTVHTVHGLRPTWPVRSAAWTPTRQR